MQDTVLKWLAELGPALRVGLSFKLHSQFIVEKKYLGPWICGLLLVAPVAFPQYCPFHSASPETCHLLQLLVTPAPLLSESTAAQLPSLPWSKNIYQNLVRTGWEKEEGPESPSCVYESFPLKSATA